MLEPGKTLRERPCEIAPLRIEIALLERIPIEVVELGSGRINEFVTMCAQRSKRTPAEPQRVLRFGIRIQFDMPSFTVEHRKQARAINRRGWHLE